jgi:DNA-binding CsgD family transcriptional regulator
MTKQLLNSRRIKSSPGIQSALVAQEHVTDSVPVADHLPGLSRRESEVLSWVAHGKTNSEVGMILGISRRTVDTLLSRTYQKLGVETRLGAVMRMIKFIKVSMICLVADVFSDLSWLFI